MPTALIVLSDRPRVTDVHPRRRKLLLALEVAAYAAAVFVAPRALALALTGPAALWRLVEIIAVGLGLMVEEDPVQAARHAEQPHACGKQRPFTQRF